MEIKNVDQLFSYFRKRKESIIEKLKKDTVNTCKEWPLLLKDGEMKCHEIYRCFICKYIEHLLHSTHSPGKIEMKSGAYKGTSFMFTSSTLYPGKLRLHMTEEKKKKIIKGDPLSISLLLTWSTYLGKHMCSLPIQAFYICNESETLYRYTQLTLSITEIEGKYKKNERKESFLHLLRKLLSLQWNVTNVNDLKKIELVFYNGEFLLSTLLNSQMNIDSILFLPKVEGFVSSEFLPVEESEFRLSLSQIHYCMYARMSFDTPIFCSLIEIYYLLFLCMKQFPDITFALFKVKKEETFEEWIVQQTFYIDILSKL